LRPSCLASLLLAVHILFLPSHLLAQDSQYPSPSLQNFSPPGTGSSLAGGILPADPYSTVPGSVLIQNPVNTFNPYTNDLYTTNGSAVPLLNGLGYRTEFGDINFNNQLGPGNSYYPFLHYGAEPQDANAKFGPIFVKFHYLDSVVLFDDNRLQSHTNRQSEDYLLLRLNLSIIAQLNDNLQFVLTGSLLYLPIQNQFGIQNNTLLFLAPALASQIVYNTVLAGWPVVFADVFRIQTYVYSDSVNDNFGLLSQDFTQDTTGVYTLHNSAYSNSAGRENDVLVFSNTVSASTNRLLPGDVRLSLTASHENLWYNQQNRGLPSQRDDFSASLVSERPSLRFKPYITYLASDIEGNPQITQQITAGIFGPIDDQLFLRAEGGYYFGAFGHSNYTYRLTLNHEAGPFTTEGVTFDQRLSLFDQEQLTSEYYSLYQILGPAITANLFLGHVQDQNLTNDNAPGYEAYYAGLGFAFPLSDRTSFQIGGTFEDRTNSASLDRDVFTGRVSITRIVTDTLTLQILYQYQNARYTTAVQSYYQNIIYLRLTKYF